LLFFAGCNSVHVYVRSLTQNYGFRLGGRLFEQIDQEGLHRLMQGAAIAGLMGLGGLVGTWLNINTPLTYSVQEASVSIQGMLDSIMPKLLPLLATLGVYWALRRGTKTLVIMLVLVVVSIVFGLFGILG
jgi:mannose/fructose/N-acetylgalactosamine-specific phosphotransferase system component IID